MLTLRRDSSPAALPPRARVRVLLPLALSLLAVVARQTPAHAGFEPDLVVSAPVVMQGPGNGSFDITLRNVGANTFDITSASLDLSIVGPSPGVTFTDVTIPTPGPGGIPYIFSPSFDQNNSLSLFTNVLPDQFTMTADSSDINNANPGGFTAVGPGDSFLLAHVSFTIDPNATLGSYALQFGQDTSFADNSDPSDTLTPKTEAGSIAVVTVPEPSSLALSGLAGAMLLARRMSRRRRDLSM